MIIPPSTGGTPTPPVRVSQNGSSGEAPACPAEQAEPEDLVVHSDATSSAPVASASKQSAAQKALAFGSLGVFAAAIAVAGTIGIVGAVAPPPPPVNLETLTPHMAYPVSHVVTKTQFDDGPGLSDACTVQTSQGIFTVFRNTGANFETVNAVLPDGQTGFHAYAAGTNDFKYPNALDTTSALTAQAKATLHGIVSLCQQSESPDGSTVHTTVRFGE